MKTSKIWMTIMSVLIVICLCLCIYYTYTIKEINNNEYYTMYIGTNDKDTNKLEMPLEDAFAKVQEVCEKYLNGATFNIATGYWTNEKGEISYEKSVEAIIANANKEDVFKIADELLKELNQDTIFREPLISRLLQNLFCKKAELLGVP